MRVIVTCGPSYEPIDQVRRLTNFSTGELGLQLSATLAGSGHEVICLEGECATSQAHPGKAQVIRFSTNEDLLRKLEALAEFDSIAAIFHAAALCDYRVKNVRATDGSQLTASKIPTVRGELTLSLEPTTKLLPKLRDLFPDARIVGWKFELDGSRDDAITRTRGQIEECRTNACVLNGTAWGAGFGFVEPGRDPIQIPDKRSLSEFLAGWLIGKN